MKYIVSLVTILGLAGCSAMPGAYFSRATSLEGVVYTSVGAPLRDARITIGAHTMAVSDVNGRFTIARVEPGEHRVRAHHEAYETVELTMTFSRPTDVLYLRMLSAEDLVRASQQALDRGRTSEAEQAIGRALAVSPESVRARYLAAIIYTNAGRFEDARRMLKDLGLYSASPAVALLSERIAREDSK